MSWNQLLTIERDLKLALDAFEWERASEIIRGLIDQIRCEADALPERIARSLLQELRHKRQFRLVAQLAEALLQGGQRTPHVERQYAQALIDLGYLNPAERILRNLADQAMDTPQQFEARGLLGRVYKQIYVNNRSSECERNRSQLQRAIREYLAAYRENPPQNLWHGINVVALTEVALRDGVPTRGIPKSKALAKTILKELEKREERAAEGPSGWDLATAMEAHLALEDDDAAVEMALAYSESRDADVFELASTVRQMTEVWGLTDSESPGSQLMPILRAALLRKQGGSLRISQSEANAGSSQALRPGLEKLFGAGRCQTLKWYQLGLERAKSVARIERRNGQGFGTGWLVKGGDFFADQNGRLLVLTNAHVLSDAKYGDGALRPEQARANFQILNRVIDIDQIVWSSPPSQYDATFVSLKSEPDGAQPLEICARAVQVADPAPRLYVIGHPGGRDLEFSLDDCQLLAVNNRVLHYRTPTEPGSSGSPVFEDLEWKVVGLHHAGRSDMPRIDGGGGTYEANEGIPIQAIRRATLGRTSKASV